MVRPIPATRTPGPRFDVACMGDSLTHMVAYGVRPDQLWSALLEDSLRDLGCRVRVRNHGKSGNTTTQMLARFDAMTTLGVPTLAILWGGANDPGAGIAGATTQANLETMAEALFDAGTAYIVIGNTQYLNYSSGGDTVSAQTSTYATLKTYQQAAYTALAAAYPGRVAYNDLYAHMRNLIVAGTVTQGDWDAWHVADSNQHFNAAGQQIVHDAMLATITAQTAWIAALQRG